MAVSNVVVVVVGVCPLSAGVNTGAPELALMSRQRAKTTTATTTATTTTIMAT